MIKQFFLFLMSVVSQSIAEYNNVLTYYNGNYTIRPTDYNNSSKIKVQMWGDNAVNPDMLIGSSGGFIEAVIFTLRNTTFTVRTGTSMIRHSVYSLRNGFPTILSSPNMFLLAGGGTWLQTFCNFYELCFAAFGGVNIIALNNTLVDITKNFNGTNELRTNNGMIKFYY